LTDIQVVDRMQDLIVQWERDSDHRSIFLSCYRMMTENMLAAVRQQDFKDPIWVEKLLVSFAEYYFAALQAYDQDPRSAPQVWQVAHNYTRDANAWALQKLLLGVNAHINFDLVLTLDEILETEWGELSEDERAGRYWDYCYVNDIIAQTIDAVQDQVVEPAMPLMELVDKLFGNQDERLIARMLTSWRDKVWDSAMNLLAAKASGEQVNLIKQVEADALKRARAIMLTDLSSWFD
jgi:hypothetical protein